MSFFPRRLPTITLAFGLLMAIFSQPSQALSEDERSRASEIFKGYQEAITKDNRPDAEKAIASLISELPAAAAAVAYQHIVSDCETLLRAYGSDVRALLAQGDPDGALQSPQVKQDRALLAEIYKISNERTQKDRLAKEGWPAIERLRDNLLPDPKKKIEANPALLRKREAIMFRLDLCDDLAKHAGLSKTTAIRDQLTISADEAPGLMAIATAKDKRVLAANQKIAESGEVPQVDLIGAAGANYLRVLAGLPALLVDPKLCRAALMHSEDMAKHKFFDHDSPVKGRRDFTDRAKEAGTTASAENISKGQQNSTVVNRGWFHSPGHFLNLFGDFARIGFGTHERHYTQLFGD